LRRSNAELIPTHRAGRQDEAFARDLLLGVPGSQLARFNTLADIPGGDEAGSVARRFNLCADLCGTVVWNV
jgi:hypothetical protein